MYGQHDQHREYEISDKLINALEALFESSEYAEDTSSNVWDFAISIRQLIRIGLSETDLRWLVRKEFVEHGREVTIKGDDGRDFRSTGNLTFSNRTCFVLTEKGIGFSRKLHQTVALKDNITPSPHISLNQNEKKTKSGNTKKDQRKSVDGMYQREIVDQNHDSNLHDYPTETNLKSILPTWDADRRLLRINKTVIKQFRWIAMNQEAILATFEEEGWPPRIYDPLPPKREQDPKRRLSDTIKCLNRKQKNKLIQFRGDGTGEAVIWELINQNVI